MKHLLLIGTLLLVVLTVQADRRRLLVQNRAVAAAAPSYLIEEGFEEADGGGGLGTGTDGYDSSLAAAETGTINNDYATSPAPLVGSYSLFMDATAPANQEVRWTFASTETNLSCYVLFNDSTLPIDSTKPIIELTDVGGNTKGVVYLQTDGTLLVFQGSTSAGTVGTLSASTTYHIWFDWNSNGVASVEFQTSATKVGSGNNRAAVTGGNGNVAVKNFNLRADSGTGMQSIWDKLKVSTSTIGSNP